MPSFENKIDSFANICNYISHAYRVLDSPDLSELSSENLRQILGSDDLAVMDELQVYETAKRYILILTIILMSSN